MALTTFGNHPQTHRAMRTPSQHRERMLKMLHEDDWHGWKREYGSNDKMLGAWVRANIVHVMQSCPSVLAGWRATLPTHVADKMVMHCISCGLDGIHDDEKLLALNGKSTQRFARMVGNFVNEDKKNWAWVSPAWVGAPGTALRAYAQSHGWLPGQLGGQVAKSIEQVHAPSWTAWVAYPQCLQVLHQQLLVRVQLRQQMEVKTLCKTSAAWANPIDIALAQQLIAQSPEPLFLDLKAHKDVASLPEEEHARLKGLVEVHIALDGLKQLHACLMVGVFPGVDMAPAMTVELPDLGT